MAADPNEEYARMIRDAQRQSEVNMRLAQESWKAKSDLELAYLREAQAIREDIQAIRLLLEKALAVFSESK